MRHRWINALAIVALLLAVLGSTSAPARCVRDSAASAAHACCPDRSEATASPEACAGPCCAQPDLVLSASQIEPPQNELAAVSAHPAVPDLALLPRARASLRAHPPRGPPRRPPRTPTWLTHRALLV